MIRIDPWHQPYEYGGNRNGFTLRSSGSDGKSHTALQYHSARRVALRV
ncbi:MAG: hypothetical protein DMF76_08745, partial [Acidobacteria bacterium]